MKRSYYSNSVEAFLKDSESAILGELAIRHDFTLEDLQKNAWIAQIRILKKILKPYNGDAHIYFEYSIPRMGKRADVILLINGLIFVIEFKVGDISYSNHAIEQVLDYSLDLKNFHEQSHHRRIIPVVVATEANATKNRHRVYDDLVSFPLKANKDNLLSVLLEVTSTSNESKIDVATWESSLYKPTPTIIEAAQALYKGHSVQEISRSDSGAINLSKTSDAIDKIINQSKKENKKSICFITGVPGAGKTLAGLNIANKRHKFDEGEHAVFLSGNGPLVQVLQEALARNEVKDSKGSQSRITKKAALSKTKAFIQNIHHFRDDAIQNQEPSIEAVVIFDEAQRAWTLEQTHSFMSRKKGIHDFTMSEPDFLISVLDRHTDWAVVICLIGGGQEINTGEAGLPEWFSAIEKKYRYWNVFVSDMLVDEEYTGNEELYSRIENSKLNIQKELHLSVSVRSYRSERVSELVKKVLDNKKDDARRLWAEIQEKYPICLTRDIAKAKRWLRKKARGSERIGITASSGAYRLRPFGINVKNSIDPKYWFLNDKNDVRSSYYLEEAATEFDIQGLELEWSCVAWDADFRIKGDHWEYKNFRGTAWQNVNDVTRRQYLKNAYRVLLTRARQGMILFVPEGDDSDRTRPCEYYDPTFYYFKEIGFHVV
ncbi:hypothetical protein DSCA_08390 [Desulfosarcina alkanivorans]|uniref:Schlafen group 3-like DNA/RNA helicase domain-containing protein n=1 Tax=Desulfosarcina alkanivorans TaxID=571177 RepID=A0A5K7YGK1_9BACT|nr:DUF2075 domain-containing protein [Desulfosarcina alkanivorans]BBO66909.1 hypothetical protein DSCA_08390 [Desulfosarcina alkanivorans]